MKNYLSERYVYRIIDHPFDLVELTVRIWILVVSFVTILSFIFPEPASSYQLVYWLVGFIAFFLVHLVCKKISPHRFHPPHVKSLNIPLSERIRTNLLYLLVSSWYLSDFSLSLFGLTPHIDKLLYWEWIAKVINFFTVAVFLIVLLVYVGTIKPAFKKIPHTYLINDLIILFTIFLYFVYLLVTSTSLETSVNIFGQFLLGSINLMIARDLFIGKWTHNLPIAGRTD